MINSCIRSLLVEKCPEEKPLSSHELLDISQFIRDFDRVPHAQDEVNRAKLRLLNHRLFELKRELIVQETSFIALSDLEEAAQVFMCPEWDYPEQYSREELIALGMYDYAKDRITGSYTTNGPAICGLLGHPDHAWVCDDWGGPDSGGMGGHCMLCGYSFRHVMY